jgi:hypothetical protein
MWKTHNEYIQQSNTVHLVGVIRNVFDNMRMHGMEYFNIKRISVEFQSQRASFTSSKCLLALQRNSKTTTAAR